MFRSFFALTAFAAFAGQVLALTVEFGGSIGNIPASQLLTFPQGAYSAPCQTTCNTANSSIIACGDNNDACLCTNTINAQLQQCEECLFTQLIDMNAQQTDPRIGSTPALAAFSAACLASQNLTLDAEVLTLPSNWVGPESLHLNTGATIVVVTIGAALGGSLLYMLANI